MSSFMLFLICASYCTLSKLMLVERDMKKTEFAKKAKISSASLAKLGKGANVTTDVLVKICEELNCDIGDICELVPDEVVEEKV